MSVAGRDVTNRDSDRGVGPSASISAMTESEKVAVQLLRQTLASDVGADGAVTEPPALVDGLPADALKMAVPRVREALCRLDALQSARLQLAAPQDQHVTRDERGLLRALGAAQHADEAVLDSALVRLAPGRAPRTHLADAIRTLAEVLVANGRMLASPSMLRWSLPAAALTVARLHGCEPGIDTIAWPPRA